MVGQRFAEPREIVMQPGILTDRTARNAKGRWVDGDNVRWNEGLPEKLGGFVEQVLSASDSDDARYYEGRARACIEWDSLDGQNWIAIGTHCKLYLINNDRLYDITPIRKASTIINGVATTSGSPVVQITDVNHDSIDGSHVHLTGASAVGGITLDGEYEVEAVIDLDNYTVRHSSAATSTTTGGGVITAQYELNCGLESDGILDGYGTGDYGEEDYGTPRTSSTFGGVARVWSLDNWGEDLLGSPNGEALYWWDRTNGADSRATLLENAPANIEWMMVGPDDRHVIAFGCNSAVTGIQDRMFLRWCKGDDFGDWTPTSSNDAGSKRLDTGSRIVTAVKTRSQVGVFTDKQLYGMSFISGTDVYDFLPLGKIKPPISKNAAIDVDGVLYWMSHADFHVFDGSIRTMPCEIREYVFGAKSETARELNPGINKQMASKVYCRYIAEFDEIHWHFPSNFADENDRVAIYNRAEKAWYMSSIRRECGLDTNAYYGVPVSFWDERTFLDETGTDIHDEEPLVAFLESFDGEVANGAVDMELAKLIPDFKELEGTIQVNVFGRKRPQLPVTESRVVDVTADTGEFSLRFKRKRIGIFIESSAMGDHWRMDTWQSRFLTHGGR